jgi:hypothetical protein
MQQEMMPVCSLAARSAVAIIFASPPGRDIDASMTHANVGKSLAAGCRLRASIRERAHRPKAA